MSRFGLAGALAALQDLAWLDDVVRRVDAAKAEIRRIAAENGLTALPSATNFVAIDCGQEGGFARQLVAALGQEGVFVRMPFVAPQDRCIRISAGQPDDLRVLETALPKALAAVRKG